MSEMPRLRELAALLQPKRTPEALEPKSDPTEGFKRIVKECQQLAAQVGGISPDELQAKLQELEHLLLKDK